ncbi:aspartate aminotransferase family protein [Desulfosarcina widdelii]|uniref:Aspartate aminotransferase family protein n=1 Tax=Desulfosarcina widdelii TaxID=947919 RepID=A0A5K7ZC66_9BACT|nr:aspartate aminotransferase family protein [Desulfosarcina widdelii]BBO78355.1 aspartate aminotransferase family protein [Desulfosarcina widdelii]
MTVEGDSNLTSYRRQWQSHHIDDETRHWLERDNRGFIRQSLSTPCLNVLTECRRSRLKDLQGRAILDFHGNSAHQIGYAHPRVLAAIRVQLERMPFCPRRYTNIPAIELAEALAALTPDPLGKVLLAPGGTSAVGMALKLARTVTGRFKTISMWDAFHGASLDAISVGGESLFRQGIGPLLPGCEHVPPADLYRCLWDSSGGCETCGLKCARYIEYVLEKEGDVAAVIAEPIRCTAVNPPPPGYWRRVRKACDRHGALLIFDETAVCLGRTGRMFAFEHDAVVPDILVLGKGLGGGVFPLAAMVARTDLDMAPDKALGHYTHEKNPVACAAALATIDVIQSEGLVERSARLGRCAVQRLSVLKEQFDLIGDVRGRGLLFGLDLVENREAKTPAVDSAERILYACLEKGLSFKTSHGSFLTLTPPLTIDEVDLDLALDIIEDAFQTLTESMRNHES